MKKGNSFFLSESNSSASVNSSDISYNQFPSSTRSGPQNLGYDVSIISEEIEALDRIINQSLQCITGDSTKECVSTETQTGGVSSTKYVVGELLEIDELYHRLQKLTDQPQSSTDTHTSSINVN